MMITINNNNNNINNNNNYNDNNERYEQIDKWMKKWTRINDCIIYIACVESTYHPYKATFLVAIIAAMETGIYVYYIRPEYMPCPCRNEHY